MRLRFLSWVLNFLRYSYPRSLELDALVWIEEPPTLLKACDDKEVLREDRTLSQLEFNHICSTMEPKASKFKDRISFKLDKNLSLII